MRNELVLVLATALYSSHVAAQELTSVQGIWNGSCSRGGRTGKAQLVLGYATGAAKPTGQLNGVKLTGLSIVQQQISFASGEKAFRGTFSSDFNQLQAELDKGSKTATCTLSRSFKYSDNLCLFNNTGNDQYIWLDSPNGQGGGRTFILRVNQRLEIAGDQTGQLCSSDKDFNPPSCPVTTAQKYYACQ